MFTTNGDFFQMLSPAFVEWFFKREKRLFGFKTGFRVMAG